MEAITDDCETIDVLASDFLARYRDGERPTIEDYARRHPEYADSIRRMFPLVASLERIKIDEQVADDGSATLAGRNLDRLGDFRLIREIGRGGMGIVYEADQESLGRRVAIKVLPKQSLLDDEALGRFQHEAKTAAAMHHSNIVPIFGTGQSDGTHYLVMQLVDGESLDKKNASQSDQPLDCRHAAKIATQVADGLAYAHQCGVLHRDVKPANILIDKHGVAQLTDFGVAINLQDDPTMTQTLSGSPGYMAPERFDGRSDERCDVYSIGLTLYEMLAGAAPFKNLAAHQLPDAVKNQRIRHLKDIRPDIPIDLQTIIAKAINPEPRHRYQSASDLRDDLNRFLADEPIFARRISTWGRLTRWARRNPKLAAAVTVAAFAMLAATIISTVAYAMTSAANKRSVDALKTSEQTVDLALQSLNGVFDEVSGSPISSSVSIGDTFDDDSLPDVGLEPSPVSARILERLQPIYQRLSQQAPTRPDIILQMVDASIQLARIQHTLGRTPDSIKTLQSSIALLNGGSGGRQDFRPTAAKETFNEFHQVAVTDHDDDVNLRLARLANELGTMHAAEFHRDQSRKSFKAAIKAASKLDPSHLAGQIELARAHLNAGSRPPFLRRGESFDEQQCSDDLSHLNQAIDILQRIDDSKQNTASTTILHARSLLARSRMKKPVAEVVKTFESNASDENLDDFRYRKRRDYQDAVTLLRGQLGATPEDANVRFELVKTLADVNMRGPRLPARVAEAASRLQEALEEMDILRSSNPNNTLFLATEVHLRHKRSAIARTRSNFPNAQSLLSEAIDLQTSLIQTWSESVRHRCWRAMLYRSQAMMYRQWNKPDAQSDAIARAKDDMAAIDKEFADHPLVIRTQAAINEMTSP